jgi:hypothetical protein
MRCNGLPKRARSHMTPSEFSPTALLREPSCRNWVRYYFDAQAVKEASITPKFSVASINAWRFDSPPACPRSNLKFAPLPGRDGKLLARLAWRDRTPQTPNK